MFDEAGARSAEVAVRLEYGAVPSCPGASDFEAIVAQRLGYSPFRPSAPERVVVQIRAVEPALEGRLEWRDSKGEWIGEQTFPSRSGDCDELARAIGFALALQVQLMAATAAREALEATPPAAGAQPPKARADAPSSGGTIVTPAANTRSDIEAPGPGRGPSISAGAGASVVVGLAPTVVGLGRLSGTAAWSRIAVELGGEISSPSAMHRPDGGGFSEQMLFGTLAGCGLRAPWSACLLAKVGEIRVAGEGVDFPTTSSGLLLQTGVRLALTHTLGRRVHVVAHAAGLTLLTRGVVTLDSTPIWTTPRVAAELGLDIGIRFP